MSPYSCPDGSWTRCIRWLGTIYRKLLFQNLAQWKRLLKLKVRLSIWLIVSMLMYGNSQIATTVPREPDLNRKLARSKNMNTQWPPRSFFKDCRRWYERKPMRGPIRLSTSCSPQGAQLIVVPSKTSALKQIFFKLRSQGEIPPSTPWTR